MSVPVSTMAILEAIWQVVGPSSPDQPMALLELDFRGTVAWAYVKDCPDMGWVSTAGHWVCRYEQELASANGGAHTSELLMRSVRELLHQLPMYPAAQRAPLPVAEDKAQRLVMLPSSLQLLQ